MTNEEYLRLFNNMENKESKLLKNENYNDLPSLNETPNYNNLPKLNETPTTTQFNINENVNDGWNIDFQFETRIDGVKQSSDQHIQQRRQRTIQEKEQNLNEVLRENEQKFINEAINTDTDVVSLEMFNQMRQNSMMSLARGLRLK